MLNLFFCELKKLFNNKIIVLCLCFIIVASPIFSYQFNRNITTSEGKDILRSDIVKIYNNYTVNPAKIRDAKQNLEQIIFNTDSYYTLKDEDGNWLIETVTGNPYNDYSVLNYIDRHLSELVNYKAYLNDITESSNMLLDGMIIGDYDDYSIKNTIDIEQKYEELKDINLILNNTNAIEFVFDSNILTLFSVVACLLITIELFASDYYLHTSDLIRTTNKGRGTLFSIRIFFLIVITITIVLFLWGTNTLLANILYGKINYTLPLQSVDGFINSPWKLSQGRYCVFYLALKVLGLLTVSVIAACIFTLIPSFFDSLLLFSSVCTAEYILYTNIPYTSPLLHLKIFNIFSLLETNMFFKDYYNVNIAGSPVNMLVSSASFGIILCIFIYVFTRIFCNKAIQTDIHLNSKHNKKTSLKILIKPSAYEFYKVFITNKGLIVFLLLICIQFVIITNNEEFFSVSDRWYIRYADKIEGAYSEEKNILINNTKEEFDKIEERQITLISEYINGDIDTEEYINTLQTLNLNEVEKEGFDRVFNQYQYFISQRKKSNKVLFVKDVSYQKLLNKTNIIINMALYHFAICCCIPQIVLMNAENKMTILINSTKKQKKTARANTFAVFVFIISAFCLSFIPHILKINSLVSFNYAFAPAASLTVFSSVPIYLSIFMTLFIIYVFRFATGIISFYSARLLSRKTNSKAILFTFELCIGIASCLFIYLVYR